MTATTHPRSMPKRMSVEDFLAFYDARPEGEHWELIDGEPIMMTPPTKVHDRIGSNLARALNNHFERTGQQFHAYQGAGLIVPDADRFRPEADVSIEDASADYESYTDTFYLACEVISDSTSLALQMPTSHPRGSTKSIAIKRKHYAAHPDNLYVLIIAQKTISVEQRAGASGWKPTKLTSLDDTLALPAFDFSMSLAALYAGTPLAKT